ncbi:MAG: phage antirepressor N-terminal domain-containing protein, partial [Anaerolineales bacterium]|nr:phage antirepressor N-terminal domain-containing protein [Anaerolineales bacterium]
MTKALVPTVQKEVAFYEDRITAVLIKVKERREIYVPIRPVCDYLGVDWSAQYRRINRDPILAESVQGVAVTTTPSLDGRGGGRQEMLCLPLKFLPGWLFGISASRVKPELREKILRYQRESYDVLWEAFQEGRLTADTSFDDLLAGDTPAAQAYKMAAAIMKMARQQLMLEAQLGTHAAQLQVHEQRIEEIEATLGDPGQHITPEQAMQISQAVKTVAHELGKRTKRNE